MEAEPIPATYVSILPCDGGVDVKDAAVLPNQVGKESCDEAAADLSGSDAMRQRKVAATVRNCGVAPTSPVSKEMKDVSPTSPMSMTISEEVGRSLEQAGQGQRSAALLLRQASKESLNSVGLARELEYANNLGQATQILPVISTLIFALAMTELFVHARGDDHRQPGEAKTIVHKIITILLATAAATSLYTTTFAVLEVYYVQMICGAEGQVKLETSRRAMQGIALPDKHGDLDICECLNQSIRETRRMRSAATNAMWTSLACLIVAAALYMLVESDCAWDSVVSAIIMFAGIISMIYTVHDIRKRYRPLLRKFAGKLI